MSTWPDTNARNIASKPALTVMMRLFVKGPKGAQLVGPDWATAWAGWIPLEAESDTVATARNSSREDLTYEWFILLSGLKPPLGFRTIGDLSSRVPLEKSLDCYRL